MDASSPDDQLDQLCARIAAGRCASRLVAVWVARFELKEAEFRLLWLLSDRGVPLDQSQLAALHVSSPAQISALVEQLRNRGYLSGEAPPGDRRRCLWTLTEAGAELLGRIVERNADQALGGEPTVLPLRRKSA